MNSNVATDINLAETLINLEQGKVVHNLELENARHIPAFVIYLEKRRSNLEAIVKSSSDSNLYMTPAQAISPTALEKSSELRLITDKDACQKSSGRDCSSAEMCCFLSHLALWKHIISQKLEHAIIFEDDMVVDDTAFFQNTITEFLTKTQQGNLAGIIKLSGINPSDNTPETPTISRLYRNHKGAGCYMINRDACKLLIEKFKQVSEPLDHFLFNPRHTQISYWVSDYYPTSQIPTNSTLADNTQKFPWWKRFPHYKNTFVLSFRENIRPLSEFLGISK